MPRLGLDGLVGALSGFRAGLKQRGLGQVFGIRGTKRLGVTVVGRRQLHFLGREQQGFRIVQRRFNAMSGKNAAFARLGRRNRDCTCRRHACLDKRRDALGWGDGTARMNDDQRRRRHRKDLAQRVLDGVFFIRSMVFLITSFLSMFLLLLFSFVLAFLLQLLQFVSVKLYSDS